MTTTPNEEEIRDEDRIIKILIIVFATILAIYIAYILALLVFGNPNASNNSSGESVEFLTAGGFYNNDLKANN